MIEEFLARAEIQGVLALNNRSQDVAQELKEYLAGKGYRVWNLMLEESDWNTELSAGKAKNENRLIIL